ncbi:MAG: ribosome silencing factor [Isosphaeraceae bacterium]|nr:ribosome silencing factor [Isosphaeraceae bacterium]
MADLHETMSPTPQPNPRTTAETKRLARREHEAQDDVPHTAAARTTPDRVARALEHARRCARIADDNRGKEILLLDLRGATPLVDFFVIITAASRRLSHAIADEIDHEMKQLHELKLGMEGSEEGRWVLIDYGDFVVHVFSPEAREYYALEEIWGDAPRLEWQDPARAKLVPAPEPSADA